MSQLREMLSDEHNLLGHQRTRSVRDTYDPSLTASLTASTFKYSLKFPSIVQVKPSLL